MECEACEVEVVEGDHPAPFPSTRLPSSTFNAGINHYDSGFVDDYEFAIPIMFAIISGSGCLLFKRSAVYPFQRMELLMRLPNYLPRVPVILPALLYLEKIDLPDSSIAIDSLLTRLTRS